MWIVAKYNNGQSQTLKENLSKILGSEIEFYQPKIMIELRKKKFFKNILGNYIFCKHSRFSEDKILNNLKFIKGLKNKLCNFVIQTPSLRNVNEVVNRKGISELEIPLVGQNNIKTDKFIGFLNNLDNIFLCLYPPFLFQLYFYL